MHVEGLIDERVLKEVLQEEELGEEEIGRSERSVSQMRKATLQVYAEWDTVGAAALGSRDVL